MRRLSSVLLSLVVVLGLLPCPALGAEELDSSYRQAVERFGNPENYALETALDAGPCSVFLYRALGTPHSAYYYLTLVYEDGSPLGEGPCVDLPLRTDNPDWRTTLPPDGMELTEEGKTLVYSYFSPLAGTERYRVDLETAQVATETLLPTREEIFEAITWGQNVEQRLDAPGGTVVLMWSQVVGLPEEENVRDYALVFLSEGDQRPEEGAWRLVLPSTAAVGSEGLPLQYPTDRAPDLLALSEDGTALTYGYTFADPLFSADGQSLHGAGRYTYTVDLGTGELSVEHEEGDGSALGGEGTTFVDVAPGDWFAPYVEVCVEEGLMQGVGQDRFDPEGTVTTAEAAALAGRLHHRKNGGDGILPAAPEEWGRLTLTFENGETYSFYSDYGNYENGWWTGGRTGGYLYFSRSEGWDGRDYQRLTLTGWTGETPVPGRAEVINNTGNILRFVPDEWSGAFHEILEAPQTPPDCWYRDTAYYLLTQDLDFPCADYAAQRGELVSALDTVVGEDLTPLNHITDYPDAYSGEREMVLRFYNAGILTGTDAVGSFSSDGYLTRAEMAAMAARVLRPELRVEFSLAEPEFQGCSLTPVTFDVDFDPLFDLDVLSPELLMVRRWDGEGQETGQVLLRADGTALELPQGVFLYQYPDPYSGQDYPLLVLSREDLTVPGGYAYGVMDPLTGEMVVPFGPYNGSGTYPQEGLCAVVWDGRHILTKEAAWDQETPRPLLLRDDRGQVVEELPQGAQWYVPEGELTPAWDPDSGNWGYMDRNGTWVIAPQYGWAQSFAGDRAIVTRDAGYGIIDRQGREVLPCIHGYLERRGDGLYRANTFSGEPYWVREDGTTFRNGYLKRDIYLYNGYFALHDRYLDENFQYATPAAFDWTGPINESGSGFVGMDGKVYRIQFQ